MDDMRMFTLAFCRRRRGSPKICVFANGRERPLAPSTSTLVAFGQRTFDDELNWAFAADA